MLIEAIEAENFMGFKAPVALTLPRVGITLISGENGGGKTSILEAVAFALWGVTLRGTSPHLANKAGFAKATLDSTIASYFPVTRSNDAAGKRSLVYPGGQAALTTTKAQELLEVKIGTFDMWRRTCVFSSDDVDRFANATDVDRKRYLEQVTDPEGKLDAASAQCRTDLRDEERKRDRAANDLALLEERMVGAKKRLQDAKDATTKGKPAVNVTSFDAAITKATEEIKLCEKVLAHVEDVMNEQRNKRNKLASNVEYASDRAEALSKKLCGECGQKIGAKLAAAAKAKVEEAIEEQTYAVIEIEKELATCEQARKKARSEIDRLQQERAVARVKREAAVRAQQAYDDTTAKMRAQMSEVEDVADEIDTINSNKKLHEKEIAILKMLDTVLGPRGVRSYFLEHVLMVVEDDANDWLLRLCGEHKPMSIELKPYAEKAAGGISDKISLKVDWGGGTYESASRGEKRRIDVAMMLGLSGLRTSSESPKKPTLWFDETMDALDEAAVDAACKVLLDISKRQSVVVITHNERIVRQLRGCDHYQVEDGKITRRA